MNNLFAALDLHISIASEEMFKILGFPITNAMVTGVLGTAITVWILAYVSISVKKGKYNRFVGLIQWVFEGLLNSIKDVIPNRELARKITPLAVTMFFFVLINYWLSVIPGLDTIRINGVPLLRSLASDLPFTLSLAIITVVAVQIYAIKHLGVFGNIGRYLRNPFKDPLGAFEGALDIIGEVSRGTSLALRLFGNAFAGEVLLIVIAVLTGFFATIALPIFMAFELLIGFIQAYVFFILTVIFTALAQENHTKDTHDSSEHSPAVTPKAIKQLE
ncbi:MAG TPA: F0F1 ATP synthase subunit A [Candidatus Saccharibacteria bacterium]|nr:F0F1 ATP synthase subunit A [Candidatus Saccharibacteria bacterium]HRQ06787.1 F0F1 ATP synthase subunit A [Candidatus Saccharibacteria bacterium]